MIVELKTLVAVARFGAFAAAGDRIGLTQAAVSGHIRRLEEELGFSLFDRTGRSATLNAAGHRTLERAKDLIARYEALRDPSGELGGGHIRVGAIASVQSTLLPRGVALFQRSRPAYRVTIESGVSLKLIDMTDGAELDLAVVLRPSYGLPKSLAWRPLMREPYMLAVPSDLPGDDWAALLATHPFIRYERVSPGGRQVESFLRERHIDVRDAIEADDVTSMLALVAEGTGVALFPLTEVCQPLSPKVRAVSLGESAFHREIGFVTNRTSDPAVALLGQCLEKRITA